MKQKLKSIIFGIPVGMAIALSVGFQSDFFEIAKQIDIYTTLFKELNIYYVDEINPAELTKQAINNTLENLDPYTRYFDEQGVEDARISSSGEYGGIGAVTRYKDNILTIREILKESPAENAALKCGDQIVKINDISVSDFDEIGVSALLNGLPGSEVKLEVLRQQQLLNVDVIREKIDINPVPYFTMLDDEVGYISFTTFNDKAANEVRKAYDALKAEGMEKLMIDVRSNGGGLLNEAVRIVNYFVPKDKIVVTTRAKKEKWSDTYTTRSNPIDLDIPLAILIDDRSASASEILAGALQDYDRAIIVGERSFGKGLVQRYRELSYGTQMKVTISKYYTPSGRCIQELDYTNRDEEGNVPKFSDYGRDKYTTQNGRTVYGGGGILPDMDIEKITTTETTKVLLESDGLFNYATSYFYKNQQIADPDKFTLDDSDFKDLKNYLAQHQSTFETTAEKLLKDAAIAASKDNLHAGLNKNYEALLSTIHREKLAEIEKNKKEILDDLTEEIVKRYHYAAGVYRQKVAFDEVIAMALTTLKNDQAYNDLLNN